MKIVHIIICFVFIFFLTNCSVNSIYTDIPQFTQICVKTWKLYDVSAHTSYTVAGELYRKGQISEVEKDLLIKQGNILYDYLASLKNKIQKTIWLDSVDLLNYQQSIKIDFNIINNTYKYISDNINKKSAQTSINVPTLTLPTELKN